MAIITDPDNLSRAEVVYSTVAQKISLYPVLARRTARGNGSTTSAGATLTSVGATFTTTDAVVVGDVVIIRHGEDAGHYIVNTVTSATVLTLDNTDGTVASFSTSNTNLSYEIRSPSLAGTDTVENSGIDTATPSIFDGVTEQAVYSFSKEEWRTDATATVKSATLNTTTLVVVASTADLYVGQHVSGASIPANAYIESITDGTDFVLSAAATATLSENLTFSFGQDDLIRHPFPFEPITAEQFELGGGAAHENWQWFSDYTRKKVRTGGWTAKDTAGTVQDEYTGIITLGSLDSDTQVYFQQTDAITAPENFTFLGPVNEPVLINDGATAYKTYLKLFARKKYRTYSQAEIADIGVVNLQTIVNRFPLAHAADSAIVATDAKIVGAAPFRTQREISSVQTDGVATVGTTTFTSTASDFVTDGVAAGDTVYVTSATGTDTGYFTVASVTNLTTLEIAPDADFITFAGSTGMTFTVTSTYVLRDLTDGASANIDSVTGTLTSATDFAAAGVVAGDMVILKDAGVTTHNGVYKITNVDTTELTLDTTDRQLTAQTALDFDVVKSGMYLQYKHDEIVAPLTESLTFADANPDTIVTTTDQSSLAQAGDIITILSGTNSGAVATIASVVGTTITLLAGDAVAAVTESAQYKITRGFARTINGITYGYEWRLFGNGATASNCYQFIQHQLRQTSDIDYGDSVKRGDITDLLMTYASPTGTTLNMHIDNLNADDINNILFFDATGASRAYPFSSSVTLSFNNNLVNDAAAKYWVFFTNDDIGDNTGRDYGTVNAMLVNDKNGNPVTGLISAASTVNFEYDYDGNVQRGGTSSGVDAPVTIVSIGLNTAQFVITTGTISRSKGINISLVSALERNYLT